MGFGICPDCPGADAALCQDGDVFVLHSEAAHKNDTSNKESANVPQATKFMQEINQDQAIVELKIW